MMHFKLKEESINHIYTYIDTFCVENGRIYSSPIEEYILLSSIEEYILPFFSIREKNIFSFFQCRINIYMIELKKMIYSCYRRRHIYEKEEYILLQK